MTVSLGFLGHQFLGLAWKLGAQIQLFMIPFHSVPYSQANKLVILGSNHPFLAILDQALSRFPTELPGHRGSMRMQIDAHSALQTTILLFFSSPETVKSCQIYRIHSTFVAGKLMVADGHGRLARAGITPWAYFSCAMKSWCSNLRCATEGEAAELF